MIYSGYMTAEIKFIPDGTVTSPRGFCAGATHAGIKETAGDRLDLGILFAERPCPAAGRFTTNQIKAAPLVLTRQRLASGRATALVANSGNANACTGEQGLADASRMAALTADSLGIPAEEVLVASTGVIGLPLPMARLTAGIRRIALSTDGGHDLARAIMTTDTRPKEVAVAVRAGIYQFTIGGIAKGSGMIHPQMATMLGFLTTDAEVSPDFLQAALGQAADNSFNLVSVDGDTSPNDMVLIMASGLAGNPPITAESELAGAFQQALEQVCIHLARSIARDGEGATRLIEVTVSGARDTAEARQVARTIVSSPLVKAAVHGGDPNWGRIVAAAGRSGVAMEETRIDLHLGDICLLKGGQPQPFPPPDAAAVLNRDEVPVKLHLNLGTASATAWGCDLSPEYVTINSQYTT